MIDYKRRQGRVRPICQIVLMDCIGKNDPVRVYKTPT